MKKSFKQIIDALPVKVMAGVTLVFFIGMIMGTVGYSKFFKNITSVPENELENSELPQIIEEDRETTKGAGLINIVLLGHGGGGHSGGGLKDSIIVVSVNKTDKKVGLISIPRDFWFSGHKINADPSIKDAVSAITGLSIPNYISIDFNGFIKAIDLLGGVTVDTKKAFLDEFYPVKGKENELCGKSPEEVNSLHQKYSDFQLEKQFTCRYETISYGVGLHNMTGEETLKYVRSRHGDGDFGRSIRQFEVLKAILQKANVKLLPSAFEIVNTNFTLDEIKDILTNIGNPLEYSVTSIHLTDQNVLISTKSSTGAYILIPKEGVNIKDYMKESL